MYMWINAYIFYGSMHIALLMQRSTRKLGFRVHENKPKMVHEIWQNLQNFFLLLYILSLHVPSKTRISDTYTRPINYYIVQ